MYSNWCIELFKNIVNLENFPIYSISLSPYRREADSSESERELEGQKWLKPGSKTEEEQLNRESEEEKLEEKEEEEEEEEEEAEEKEEDEEEEKEE